MLCLGVRKIVLLLQGPQEDGGHEMLMDVGIHLSRGEKNAVSSVHWYFPSAV